ncbi:hypothetical protein [Dactylosporangium sp. NPDC048998]
MFAGDTGRPTGWTLTV